MLYSKLKTIITSSLVLSFGATLAFADDQWEEVYDDNNIRVEVKQEPGDDIKSFKASTILPGSVDAVMAVLADPNGCAKWIHNCERAEILDSDGLFQRNTYQVNDFPWPTKDRDIVLEVRISQNLNDNTIRYDLINKPDYVKQTDKVRIKKFHGYYLLKPIDDTHTRIEWSQHANPGGGLPDWLVNAMILDVPINTLKGLSQLVTEMPYAKARLKRDSNGLFTGWEQKISQGS